MALTDSLDDLIQDGLLTPQLAMKVLLQVPLSSAPCHARDEALTPLLVTRHLVQFDKSLADTLHKSVKCKTTIKVRARLRYRCPTQVTLVLNNLRSLVFLSLGQTAHLQQRRRRLDFHREEPTLQD